jgi:hypothetical protein
MAPPTPLQESTDGGNLTQRRGASNGNNQARVDEDTEGQENTGDDGIPRAKPPKGKGRVPSGQRINEVDLALSETEKALTAYRAVLANPPRTLEEFEEIFGVALATHSGTGFAARKNNAEGSLRSSKTRSSGSGGAAPVIQAPIVTRGHAQEAESSADEEVGVVVPFWSIVEPVTKEVKYAIEPEDDHMILVRVTLCNPQRLATGVSHDVLELDLRSSLPLLIQTITEHFRKLSTKAKLSDRPNLTGYLLNANAKVTELKVVYEDSKGSWDQACDGVAGTILTDDNSKRVMRMLKAWRGRDMLCASIGCETD